MQPTSRIVVIDKCDKDPLPPLNMKVAAASGYDVLGFGLSMLKLVTQMVPIPEDLVLLTITIENITSSNHGILRGVVVKCLELPFEVEVEGAQVTKKLGPFFRDPITFDKVTEIDGVPLFGDLSMLETEH